MNMLSIDLTAITAILVGGAILLIPVLGITLRLVLPLVIETLAAIEAVIRIRRDRAASAADAPAPPERGAPRDLVAVR